ncbi:ABC transporter substrate-binding protein [Paracoccus sp. S3-43]|uniref:glycine betaine ABC transporter substrate-binding protein OsmF n=1 Tax=Paracoccus sp. S3-43 TaxID=3030011 RepID=UPI0023AF3EAE|nr:ABC transporter substrate-binding protein [Paracoccus sp. S3-43]WEF24927.1 ABC transporter substrate-binding protein [Paracoccus sp. S3-43]
MPRLAPLAATLLLAATPLAAQDIVVSSKIDTEGGLLGNMILLALKDAGLPVQDKLQLGGTPIMRDAIVAGQIDIYPEYTANGAFFFNEGDSEVWKNAAQGYARVAELDKAQNDIVWLKPAPANNTWAIALRQDVAEPNGLASMSQMGAWIADGGAVKLAASSEFVTSPAALPAFQQAYGFTLTPDQLVQLAGGDTAATIAAAAQHTSGVNAAMVYGTDGAIAEAGLVVMEDDKSVQPVYQPAPIVRASVLAAHPRIAEVLEPIFASLTLETLQTLNGRIQIGGEPAAAVAEDYLTQAGLLD